MKEKNSNECEYEYEYDKYSINNYKGSVSKEYDKIYTTALIMNEKYELKFEHKCQYKGCNNIPQISEQLLKGDMYICPTHRRKIAQSLVASVNIDDDESKNNSDRSDIKYQDIKDPMLKKLYNILTNMCDSELLQSSNNCGLPKDYFAKYYAKIKCRMYDIAEILNSNQLSDISSRYMELKLEYIGLQQIYNLLFTIRNTSNPFFLTILTTCMDGFAALGAGFSHAKRFMIVKKLQEKIGKNKELKNQCQVRQRTIEEKIHNIKEKIDILNYNFKEIKKNLQSHKDNIKHCKFQKCKIERALIKIQENTEQATKDIANISQRIEEFKTSCDNEASELTSTQVQNVFDYEKLFKKLKKIETKQQQLQRSKKQQLKKKEELKKTTNDEIEKFNHDKTIYFQKQRQRNKLRHKQKGLEKKEKEEENKIDQINFDLAVTKAEVSCVCRKGNRPCIFIVYDTRKQSEYSTSADMDANGNVSSMMIGAELSPYAHGVQAQGVQVDLNQNHWNIRVNKQYRKYGHYAIFQFETDIPYVKYKRDKIVKKLGLIPLLKDENCAQKVCEHLNEQIEGTTFCVFKIEKTKTHCWKKGGKNNFYLYHDSNSFSWVIYVVNGNKNKV